MEEKSISEAKIFQCDSFMRVSFGCHLNERERERQRMLNEEHLASQCHKEALMNKQMQEEKKWGKKNKQISHDPDNWLLCKKNKNKKRTYWELVCLNKVKQ